MPPNKESKLNDFIFKLGEVQLSGLKRPQVDRMLGRAFLLFMVDPLHYDTVTKTDSKWFSHLLQNHNAMGERTHFYCVLIPSPHMTFHKTCLVRQIQPLTPSKLVAIVRQIPVRQNDPMVLRSASGR